MICLFILNYMFQLFQSLFVLEMLVGYFDKPIYLYGHDINVLWIRIFILNYILDF